MAWRTTPCIVLRYAAQTARLRRRDRLENRLNLSGCRDQDTFCHCLLSSSYHAIAVPSSGFNDVMHDGNCDRGS
jgi:hypothetical protein